jgi:tryptophan-rich sensory protein
MFDRGSWISLVPFVVVCFTAAAIGSLFTSTSINTWYTQLRRPEWTPPNWIFGPVWTALYLMMAISAWLVWRDASWPQAGLALALFAVQLVLNSLWSVIFFGLHRIGTAFGEILILWTMIVATAVAFLPISLLATWLLIPYLLWVVFASYLNFRIWQMN